MSDIITGYAKGRDFEVAKTAVHLYADEHGWKTREVPKAEGIRFDYEFSMSRNGKRESRSPAEKISVAYIAGGKAIEFKRKGHWTANIVLRDDGSISSGQFQGETGIDDLLMLRELWVRANKMVPETVADEGLAEFIDIPRFIS